MTILRPVMPEVNAFNTQFRQVYYDKSIQAELQIRGLRIIQR